MSENVLKKIIEQDKRVGKIKQQGERVVATLRGLEEKYPHAWEATVPPYPLFR